MAIAVQDQDRRPVDALFYGSSVVISLAATSQFVPCGTASAVTVATLADAWMRVGVGSPIADGLDGCMLLPAGSVWTEGIVPGSSVALAAVESGTSTAVVRFVAG